MEHLAKAVSYHFVWLHVTNTADYLDAFPFYLKIETQLAYETLYMLGQ